MVVFGVIVFAMTSLNVEHYIFVDYHLYGKKMFNKAENQQWIHC